MAESPNMYGYIPSKPAALFGVAYFGVSMIVCILQIVFGRYKHYWMVTLAVAALGESIGWGGRLWAHFAPMDWMPFMIQICSLIISPVFISAADYVLFCKLIDKIGPRLFLVRSRFFWIGFIICDIVSLAIQTVGGVEVSTATDYEQLTHGARVMRSGIIFQLSTTVIFVLLIVGTMLRLRGREITLVSAAKWPVMTAMCLSTLMLLIRNGYRIVELSDGWDGHLMRTEGFLIGLDMVPMTIAVGVFVVFSPSLFLRDKDEAGVKMTAQNDAGQVFEWRKRLDDRGSSNKKNSSRACADERAT